MTKQTKSELLCFSILIIFVVGLLIYLLHITKAKAYEKEIYKYDPCGLITVQCDKEPTGRIVQTTLTAYSSEKNQTDSTPFITANGQRVKRGFIANNCLPFETSVAIGNTLFTINDRLNDRYGCDVFDLWVGDKQTALNFGKQEAEIIVFQNWD